MPKITGAKAFSARLKRLTSPEAKRQIEAALFAGGEEIQVEAQISITNGAVSGKNHVPSKPGEPPNQDTGELAGNIETNVVGPLHVQVSSNAPYAVPLEFGTSKLAERPYMRPATAKKRKEVVALVRAAVGKIARGGTVT
jgi:HK97 gp10 family phage protein